MDGSLTSAYADNGERFDYTYEPSTGKLLTATVSDGAESKTTTYNYSDHTNGEDANLIESVVLPTATVTYDYDGFYRASYDVEVNGSDILTTDYTFLDGIGENSTTTLVESMTTSGSDWSDTLSYTYDCKGNIETISENGEQKAKYYYDELNQLIREDNAWLGKTIAYTYDNGGNIQLVEEYAYTSGALDGLTATNSYTYLYGDSNWKDKLTSFNGNAITYDEIGNPLTYYNGYTFDWQNGRQLAGVTGTGRDFSYTYNADGIRTSKTINGITTTYTLEGSNIVKETNGTDTIWYYYDAVGSLTGFEFNGTPYFYVKNVQGDIVAITNANGNIVVEYTYDSWGKLVSISGPSAGSLGTKNHFLYRGYYYDHELGLYYLNSRYYDPNTKRFVNADKLISVGKDVLGCNMFSYCANDPINKIDSMGMLWEKIQERVKKIESVAERINTQLIVAQTIYGEEHGRTTYSDWKEGQTAVAAVIQNRLNANKSYLGTDLVTICTSGQFKGYIPGKEDFESGEYDKEAWDSAMDLAECIVVGENINPPSKITSNHLYFNKTSTFNKNLKKNNGWFSFGPGTTLVKPKGVVKYGGNTFFYY